MATKYPNFAAEMARSSTNYEEVYKKTAKAMGKSTDTIQNWITGRAGELPVTAAFEIKNSFFPNLSVDYLFEQNEESVA